MERAKVAFWKLVTTLRISIKLNGKRKQKNAPQMKRLIRPSRYYNPRDSNYYLIIATNQKLSIH